MRNARNRRRRRQRGLTLIEILVVVTILGAIASIIGINVFNQHVDAQIKTAKIQLKNFDSALDLYRVKYHEYPSTAQGLAALINPPRGGPALMNEIPRDPWDNEYVYTQPSRDYDLVSKGPDGVAQTDDDITRHGTRDTRVASR